MMTRDEISKIESGFFWPVYDLFERGLKKTNSSLEGTGIKISLFVKDDFNLNAHAKKKGNDFYIVLLSGLIPITFDILAENVEFFMEEYPDLKDKEAPVALGCVFIWHHIFGHEIGHIARGHLSLVESKETNLVGDYQVYSMGYNAYDDDFSENQIKTLMEYDADVFSAPFVADVVLNTIKNNSGGEIEEKTLIGVCLTSIFFFFNFLCQLEGKESKYPPAMVRANALQSYLIQHLSKKTKLSDEELEDLMHTSIYNAYSYLVDNNKLFQPMDDVSLNQLYELESKLLRQYSVFDKVLTGGISVTR
ncbi:hypothetical protein V6C39_08100 [Dickeya ananatis]|uniref:hypothetical protein n=1 Tax=Dickeya ananatis TaxID=3061286 RepID=UPI00388FD231